MIVRIVAIAACLLGAAAVRAEPLPVAQLIAAPAESMGRWVERFGVSAPVAMPALSVAPIERARAHGTAVAEVTGWEPQTVGAFVERWVEPVPEPSAGFLTVAALADPEVPASLLPPASAPPVVAAPLVIDGAGGRLTVDRENLQIAGVGQAVAVTARELSWPDVKLFVRDPALVTWDPATRKLRGLAPGETEVYVVARGEMRILAVGVEALPQLAPPVALTDLNLAAGAQRGQAALPQLPAAEKAPQLPRRPRVLGAAESVSQARLEYRQLTIKVVDDRSVPKAGLLYPVAGLEVALVGTEFRGVTDATGAVHQIEAPAGARLLVSVRDPSGSHHRTTFEVPAREDEGQVMLTVMRRYSLAAIREMAGVPHGDEQNSLCGYAPGEGFVAELDVRAAGPFYFNRYGFVDGEREATGPTGRYCFFEIPSGVGPVALQLESKDGAVLLPLAVWPEQHHELGRTAIERADVATDLVVAHDSAAAESLTQLDWASLWPLSFTEDEFAPQEGGGVLGRQLVHHRGRSYFLARDAEFEEVLYSWSSSGLQPSATTPLFPRGLLENTYLQANIYHDEEMGAVIVEHGAFADERSGEGFHSVHLLDTYGRPVGTGVISGEGSLTRAMFFNVPPGRYAVHVEGGSGAWLAADTVLVYNGTASYVRTGSPIAIRRENSLAQQQVPTNRLAAAE